MAPSIAIDIHPEGTAARVDAINTTRYIRRSLRVISRCFASSIQHFRCSGGFCAWFDSRQLHQRLRRSPRNFGIAAAKVGPLGGFGFIGPCDGVMAGREASSACRQIRVVDYAFQPAAIARHWAQHALRGTDARRPAVRRAPHDGGATCSMCRRLLPVLADAASTGPTSPLPPPDVGFTRARPTVGVLTGSTVRCG